MSVCQKAQDGIIESLDVLPMLADKFVVDFVSGIHSNNDHITVQKKRTGFISRLMDGLTGEGSSRQIEINTNLAVGVESSLKWLIELSEAHAHSNYALVCVNNRLNALKQDVAQVANFSADTRQLLEALSVQVAERCGRLEHELVRINYVQRAQLNMELVFSKWEAGGYQHLAIASRCYAALEELQWGAFGDFHRNNSVGKEQQDLMSTVKNKIIYQLSQDANIGSDMRLSTQDWLSTSNTSSAVAQAEALVYLGDAFSDVEHPFTYSATQQPTSLPLRMPCLCSAERLGNAMQNEVFGGRGYV